MKTLLIPLHRLRRGHGFEFRSGLNFSSGFRYCLSWVYNCDDQSRLHMDLSLLCNFIVLNQGQFNVIEHKINIRKRFRK